MSSVVELVIALGKSLFWMVQYKRITLKFRTSESNHKLYGKK